MTFGWKLGLARAARAVAHRLGRSGGTTAPGRLLLRLEPDALERLGTRLEDGAVVVSATNGKTTTAGMLAGILERAGESVVHNRAGSNMHWGVATALLDAGREPHQVGLLEVDEGWLAPVARALDARLFLLSNLFRDQLDRYGELDIVADRWAELVAERDGRSRFVLNADDPLVADLGRDRAGVTHFGVDDDAQRLPGPPARRGLQALSPLRRRLSLRRRLPRPPGPLRVPATAAAAARRSTWPRSGSSCAACRAPTSASARRADSST